MLYSYSDSDHYYGGEKRDFGVERSVQPSTLSNEFTGILEADVTEKFSVVAEVPFMYTRQVRGLGGVSGAMVAAGLGDVRAMARAWLLDTDPSFRLYGGLGLRLPTGASDEKFTAQNGTRVSKDLAAQPGTGNVAAILEVGGSARMAERVGIYYRARYIVTPYSETDAKNFRNELTNTGPRRNSDSDSATVVIGSIWSITQDSPDSEPSAFGQVAATLGVQAAWVPYHDLIGATKGFRRAGIILFVEPGLSWSPRPTVTTTLSVPITVYRKIQRNAGNIPEIIAQASVTFTF
ncbi:MAG: hypothetical protein KDC38_17190 [Planctomycetes bacterium]|nr:hypothetical protein [Planctomycetota bacterium]